MSTVHIPGIGNVPKGWAIFGGVVGVGFAFFAYRKYQADKSSSSSTAATAPSTGTSTAGNDYPADGTIGNPNDPYSTDPSTGMTYGEEQTLGITSNDGGDSGVGEGYYPPVGSTGGTGSSSSNSPTNQTAWVQDAQTALVALGYSSETVASALAQYIAGMTLSADNANLVQIALSEIPYPGTAPPVLTSGSGSGGSSGGSGGTNPTPPIVVAKDLEPAGGLHVVSITKTEIQIAWTAVAHATSYHVGLWTGGKQVREWDTIGGKAAASAASLNKSTTYTLYVTPHASGYTSPTATSVSAKTSS